MSCQEAPGGHVIGRAINRFDSQQSSVAEAEDGTRRTRRITANDRLIAARRQAGNLQLQCALVAPEPGNRGVGQRFAHYSRRDAPCLISGVLHRLQSNDLIVE